MPDPEDLPIEDINDKNVDDPASFYANKEDPIETEIKVSKSVELIFLLLGTNVLFAYNTFINGIDFFDKLFPGKDAETNVARVYNIVASLMYFISLPFIERFPLVGRFYTGSIGITVCMLFHMIYNNVGAPNFIVTLVFIGITACFSGILFGTTMGYAGLFGVNTSAMANAGLALGGICTAITRVLSKQMGPGEGWFFFGFTFVFNLISVICFGLFQRTEIAKSRLKDSTVSSNFLLRMSRIGTIFKKVWPFIIQAALCMTITLTLFPGYAIKIPSKHGLEQSWVTTIITSSYMVGDFLGRFATRWFSWPSPKFLWIPQICRLLFFPLYMIPIEGVWLEDDIFIYFVTLFLALTGGFWIGLCITYTAQDESLEPDEVELAVFTTTLFLNIGIFIGSWLTYALP